MSTIVRWQKVSRAPFLTASGLPVLVGTSLAWASTRHIDGGIFALALLGIMLIHAGANLANEYFDHVLGADKHNPRPSSLFGGSGSIQDGLVLPRHVLIASVLCLAIGATMGIRIFLLTRHSLILIVGLVGILGAWFYTCPPLKLAYRTFGELTIALLFGILPVWTSYYIQTGTLDLVPLIPAIIVAILTFEIILANEFPDAPTDSAAGKSTIVVRFGTQASAALYVLAMAEAYASVLIGLRLHPQYSDAWLLLLLTCPVAICAVVFLYRDILRNKGIFRFNALTIALHGIACLLMTAGFMLYAWSHHGFF
jgi:1,4-dihydroxy-2-naphthoate octaprenyltransferase